VKPRRNPQKRTGASSTNRAVIAMAVIGALVLLYGWNSAFLAPRGRARVQAAKELSAALKDQSDLRQSLAQLRTLAANTKTREAELARLGTLIPADTDLAGAILILNDTAKQAGVDWSSFTPSTPSAAAGGGPLTLSITMSIGGSFGQVFDYMRRLETLDRLVVVDSLQLNGAGGASGQTKLQAEIRARMFGAGTGPAPAPATLVKAGA
jgi:Tfp pilus assembly protein PilO